MIIVLKKAFLSVPLLFLFAACSQSPAKEETTKPDTDTTVVTPPEPVDSVDWSWKDGYPVGVKVESFTEDFDDGQKCSGFIATIDFKANPNLRFNCLLSNKKRTPSAFFSGYRDFTPSEGVPCLATNGGYFAGSTSVSLLYHDGSCRSIAQRAINWPRDEQTKSTVYPVRSAIGQMEDGHFEIQWAYCTSPSSRTHTAFPSPLDNNEQTETFMSEAPTPAYCEGTFTWTPVEAVGGGPRLVKDGVDVSTESYWGECLNAGGTSGMIRVNRTAAGIRSDGALVLIVCDGRGANGSAGYTLAELAAKFISLGCTDATNLDGGGSSCMVGSNGEVLNNPSDKTGERPVSTAIVISELVPENNGSTL